jgi:hypothetical protein
MNFHYFLALTKAVHSSDLGPQYVNLEFQFCSRPLLPVNKLSWPAGGKLCGETEAPSWWPHCGLSSIIGPPRPAQHGAEGSCPGGATQILTQRAVGNKIMVVRSL